MLPSPCRIEAIVSLVITISILGLGQIWLPNAKTSPTRCLIVSIDNRPFNWDPKDYHYPTIAAIINRDYAVQHQYDYLYIMNDVNNFVPRVRAKYRTAQDDPMMLTEQVEKDIATGFNVYLQQYRAASWAKLPALWHITRMFMGKYDYIWYIDSDAFLNPLQFNHSITDKVSFWKQNDYVLRGQRDIDKSTFIFFSNFPWRDDMPCAGTFLFRPTPLAEQVLRQWWDFNLPIKNFKHFHEQDALWHMIEHPEYGYLMSAGGGTGTSDQVVGGPTGTPDDAKSNAKHIPLFSIVKEQQFPSAHTRYESLWLLHVASYNFALRTPLLCQALKLLRRGSSMDAYNDAVDMLSAYHIYVVDPLQVAESMEGNNTASGSARITKHPPHDVRTQSTWYDAHVSSKDMTPLPTQQLYEGRLVRFKREFFFVSDGLKRPFSSYPSLLNLHIPEECAHVIGKGEVGGIPHGKEIGENPAAQERNHLLRYYLPSLPPTPPSAHYPYETELYWKQKHKDKGEAGLVENGSSSRPEECVKDSELLSLMSKHHAVFYIWAHDQKGGKLAKHYVFCKEAYMKVISIPSTVFFESIVYKDIIPELIKTPLPAGSYVPAASSAAPLLPQYVIIGTYKTVSRHLHYNAYTQSLTQVRVMLRCAVQGQYDLVPFLRSGSAHLPFATYFHGPVYKQAWDALLKGMGYSEAVVRGFDQNMQIFFRNIFIVKRSLLVELSQFMTKAMEVALNNEEARKALQKDAKYKEGEEQVAMRIFNTSYYQLHPFIFERLPAFFAYAHNKTACAAKAGVCRYNS